MSSTRRFLKEAEAAGAEIGEVRYEETDHEVADLAGRSSQAIVRPQTIEQVAALVSFANQSSCRPKLAAYSTGLNWGLGSRAQSDTDVLLVDLSSLKALRKVDETIVEVQAGVRQAEFAAFLQAQGLAPNLTASSPGSSVVGNLLERGVGFRGQRSSELIYLVVVLPTGEIVRVGGWGGVEPHPKTVSYRSTLGPDVAGLFLQSNLGIVLAAGIFVHRRRPTSLLRIHIPPDGLYQVLHGLRNLLQDGVVVPVVRVYSPASAASQSGDADATEYVCYAAVQGPSSLHDACRAVALDAVRCEGVRTHWIDWSSETQTALEATVVGAWDGRANHSTRMIANVFGVAPDRVDSDSARGFRFVLPLVPFQEEDLRIAYRSVEAIAQRQSVAIGVTLNVISDNLVDFVTVFRHSRDSHGIAVADAVSAALYTEFMKQGYAPYRLDSALGRRASLGAGNEAYDGLLLRLSKAVDPAGVMARGRYV